MCPKMSPVSPLSHDWISEDFSPVQYDPSVYEKHTIKSNIQFIPDVLGLTVS